jgi:hypothetical protein
MNASFRFPRIDVSPVMRIPYNPGIHISLGGIPDRMQRGVPYREWRLNICRITTVIERKTRLTDLRVLVVNEDLGL